MNMLMSLENTVGKIRDIYLNSLYIANLSAVLLKKISETSTPTQYGRILMQRRAIEGAVWLSKAKTDRLRCTSGSYV